MAFQLRSKPHEHNANKFALTGEILSKFITMLHHFKNGVGEKQMQLSRSICVNQISEDEK
jgi:hypothetical protein